MPPPRAASPPRAQASEFLLADLKHLIVHTAKENIEAFATEDAVEMITEFTRMLARRAGAELR